MNKLEMKTTDIVNENIKYIQDRFPNAIVETEKGFEVDFNTLKQEMSNIIADDTKEKYQLTWPGKKEAILLANTRTTKTLRPIKEKSVDFDNTENIYIEGDNLEALKILQESYLNKIKCIYIDPPYNTGNDFIYNDNFNKNTNEELEDSGQVDEEGNRLVTNTESNGRFHSDWLSMMYSRLKLARNLLTEDGVIFISIDDNELVNLKKICDEIYGESNWKSTFVWRKTHTQTNIGDFARVKEYILCYSKEIKKCIFNRIPLSNLEEYRYKDKNGEKFRRINLIDNTRGRYEFSIINPNNNEIFGKWMKPKEDIEQLIAEDKVYWAGETPYGKNYLKDMLDKGQIANDFLGIEYGTNQRSTMHLDKMMDNSRVFDFSKPIELITHFINLGCKDNDIILDFFSGSATTAHASMKLNAENDKNRKYIMVQIPEKCDENSVAYKNGFETICEIGEERIRRAGKKIKEETNANIDYGFRVYKIDSSNMKDVYYKPNDLEQAQLNLFETNVKDDRTNEDLLTQIILDLGLTLDLKIEEKNFLSNKVYYVAENSLVACFDKNIDINIIDEICKCKPLKIVFKEECFNTDNLKINVQEKIKKLSPESEVYVL